MTSYIRQLHIENFKSLKDNTIGFRRLTVLAGANSVGKSTVIQSLLLSRICFDIKANKGDKISINEHYLMQLGFNNQITNHRIIKFQYLFENEYHFDIDFKVNSEQSYLEVGVITGNPKSSLYAPNFHYLNAERIGPRPSYGTKVSILPTTGYQGEYTIELLTNGQLSETQEVKNFHNSTNTEGESLNTLSQQTELWMNFIIPDIRIDAKKIMEVNRTIALFNYHTAPNVGFGISYVLPIIVSGLIAEENSILIIENPEAHLHPYGQSKIGQFLAMVAASGVQVIIETHSEHIINGIRLASAKNIINTNDIQINFFKKENNDIKILPISINDASDLSQFPKGFFDQTQRDAMEMLKIKKSKNLL